MKRVIFLVIAIICLITAVASAHHAWVEREGDKFKIGWGHPPHRVDPYEPKRVKDIKGFDLNGKETVLKRTDEKERVYLSSKEDISMITLSFEGGYLVTTPEGKKRMTKREAQRQGLQIVDSFYSSQFAKSIFKYSDIVIKPTGMKFEIVPLKNPLSLRQGEILPVMVLYEGKPLEGAKIEIGYHKEAGRTDKDGVANIKLDEPIKMNGHGLQVIIARFRTPSNDPDADFLSFITALTWEAK